MCKPLAASLDGAPSSEAEPLHVSLYRSLADAELCRKISCLETHARASVFDSRVPRARVHFEAPLLVATRTHDRRAAPPMLLPDDRSALQGRQRAGQRPGGSSSI